jgi:ribonucleoside-diphosphate reductase alpha chain
MTELIQVSDSVHSEKYRLTGESFRESTARIANALSDDVIHYEVTRDILLSQKFLPAGRIQSSAGSPRKTTAFNCYVSGVIEDSMDGIMDAAKEAAKTMRLGGGIGYDFSTLRPRGDRIRTLDSPSSGPLSFMEIFDSVCKTVSSAGNRRGAQMGVLRVDHPDIEEFIEAKANTDKYTQFNLSVAVTDKFMDAVEKGEEFDLVFDNRVYSTVDARSLYEKIMRATWDWAEPGILFIDQINNMNNLSYCETIAATNPCGEQPLPPYGACLLGSFNLPNYLYKDDEDNYQFDMDSFKRDIPPIVRMLDNVIDRTIYPLERQHEEAISKRRMGIGVTGEANCFEALGYDYGSVEYLQMMELVHSTLANECYRASSMVAKEKGSFPLYDERYLDNLFIERLDSDVLSLVREYGIRNSHLLSIAPTGTISLCANNVSSSIEPVFSTSYDRTINTEDGPTITRVYDYGYATLGTQHPKTADECTIDDHLGVLSVATKWSDSAVSKTINVGDDITFTEFKDIYMKAWKLGCKGVTTFRSAGKRYGILNKVDEVEQELEAEGSACYIDLQTGKRTCE